MLLVNPYSFLLYHYLSLHLFLALWTANHLNQEMGLLSNFTFRARVEVVIVYVMDPDGCLYACSYIIQYSIGCNLIFLANCDKFYMQVLIHPHSWKDSGSWFSSRELWLAWPHQCVILTNWVIFERYESCRCTFKHVALVGSKRHPPSLFLRC